MGRATRKKIPRLLAAAAAGLLGLAAAEPSQAGLVIDLRAVSATGTTVINDSKTVANFSVGDVITYQLFAQVTGAAGDTRLEGFQTVQGVLQSGGPGTLQVDLTYTNAAPFDAAGTSNGVPTNLGGDTDIDIGVNPAANALTNIIARAANVTNGNASGLGTSEFLVGSGTITVAGFSGLSTVVGFTMPPAGPVNPRPVFVMDGAPYVGVTGAPRTTVNPGISLILIPEPAAVGLLGLAGLATVPRRRRA
jgi:hypothetical protein